MTANPAVQIGLAIIAIVFVGFLVYLMFDHTPENDDEKSGRPEPARPQVDEGIVLRIATTRDDYHSTVHILLGDGPGRPIVLAFDDSESAIPLTQTGDHVRIERHDEHEYVFTNLSTGLTVRED